MDDVLRWRYVNAYRKLVEDGKAVGFRCHSCHKPAVVKMKSIEDEELVVWCPDCGTTIKPNGAWWDELVAVVKEHYV